MKYHQIDSPSLIDQPRAISVLVVDDHALLREGLRAVISTQDDIRIVG